MNFSNKEENGIIIPLKLNTSSKKIIIKLNLKKSNDNIRTFPIINQFYLAHPLPIIFRSQKIKFQIKL